MWGLTEELAQPPGMVLDVEEVPIVEGGLVGDATIQESMLNAHRNDLVVDSQLGNHAYLLKHLQTPVVELVEVTVMNKVVISKQQFRVSSPPVAAITQREHLEASPAAKRAMR